MQFTAKLTGNIVSGMPNIANFTLCPRVVYSKLYCLRFKTILSKNMILDTRIGLLINKELYKVHRQKWIFTLIYTDTAIHSYINGNFNDEITIVNKKFV